MKDLTNVIVIYVDDEVDDVFCSYAFDIVIHCSYVVWYCYWRFLFVMLYSIKYLIIYVVSSFLPYPLPRRVGLGQDTV